jgi:galacturan 1,4-alpha-galacturonidase
VSWIRFSLPYAAIELCFSGFRPIGTSSFIMKFFSTVSVALLASSASAYVLDERKAPAAIPRGAEVHKPGYLSWKPNHHKHKFGHKPPHDRSTVTIRASTSDTDDVSDDFLWAMKKANNGGSVYLRPNETYVLGQKLDLSFLNDIYVQLDGEIKVRALGCL